MAYKDGRPVFYDLPYVGYQDNEVVEWLTRWYDQKLVDTATLMETFWEKLIPEEAPEEYLDYLAFLVGLSGNYWDTNWAQGVKRKMIKAAHSLWSKRGSLEAIREVLGIHEIPYSFWSQGSLVVPFNVPGTFGVDDMTLYLRMPLTFSRTSRTWIEAQRTLKNYAPVMTKATLGYDFFYVGFSIIGERVF